MTYEIEIFGDCGNNRCNGLHGVGVNNNDELFIADSCGPFTPHVIRAIICDHDNGFHYDEIIQLGIDVGVDVNFVEMK